MLENAARLEDEPVETITPMTENLFDADAEQRVELTLTQTDKRGNFKKYKVAHVFAPVSDNQFFQYEDKKNIIQKVSGTDMLNVRTENKSLQAAEWLWNQLALRREGYIEREDWREKTNLLDKSKSIEQGLLAVFVVNDNETDVVIEEDAFDALLDENEFSDELADDDVPTIILLDCLFNNVPLTTKHSFNQPSAADVADYDKVMRKASNMIDSRRGFRAKKQIAQVSIPSKARELSILYDRLINTVEGYEGRVPAHHKREAVLELFGRDADVTEKN